MWFLAIAGLSLVCLGVIWCVLGMAAMLDQQDEDAGIARRS